MPVLIPESLREDFHQNVPSSPLPRKQSAGQGQAAVLFPAIAVSPRCPDALSVHGKELGWRDHTQVGIPRDLLRPTASPFREISFGQGLQTPGNAPEQMFPVPRPGFLLKHFPIFVSQSRHARPAQALDFHQNCIVHRCCFLSVAVNHSHMNALGGLAGKSKVEHNFLLGDTRQKGEQE